MCSVHILTHCLFGVQMQKMNVIVRVCAILVMMGGTLAQEIDIIDEDDYVAGVLVNDDSCVVNYQGIFSDEMEKAIRFLADHLDCKANELYGACEPSLSGGQIRRRAVTVESTRGVTSCVRMSVENTGPAHFELLPMSRDSIIRSLEGNFRNCEVHNADGVLQRGYFFVDHFLSYVFEVDRLLDGICENMFPGGTLTCSEEDGRRTCPHSGGMTDRFIECDPYTGC